MMILDSGLGLLFWATL